MRVALACRWWPQPFILRQAAAILDAGHDVDLFTPETGPPIDDLAFAAHRFDQRIQRIAIPDGLQRWLHAPRAAVDLAWREPRLARAALRRALHLRALRRRMVFARPLDSLFAWQSLTARTGPPHSLLHAHGGPAAALTVRLKPAWRCPLVVTFHGPDIFMWPSLYGPEIFDEVFAGADRILSVSRHGGEQLRELGCPEEKLEWLPCGVPLKRFSFRPRRLAPGEPVRLLSVARLHPLKGLGDAILAVAEVVKEVRGLRYDIVGGGPDRTLLQRVRDLGLGEVVRFRGSLSNAEVARAMAAAHLFVHPSARCRLPNGLQFEGSPVAILEAQASGLPVIATRHGGIPEVTNAGRSGELVEERDVPALRDALLRLIRAPQRWEALGRAGRAHVCAYYDEARLNRRLLELYGELTAPAASARAPRGTPAWADSAVSGTGA